MGETQLKRSLSTIDLLSIGVGAVIGWSWVIYAGPWSTFGGSLGGIIAFILGGIICSFVGLTYAELSSTMPRAGGDVSFSFIGLGDKWGYLSGATVSYALLTLLIVETLMFPLILVSLGFPLIKFGPLYELGGETVYVSYILISIFVNFLFAFLNYKGIEFSRVFQTITVGVLLIAAIFYVFAGVSLGELENARPLFTSTSGLILVMLMVPGFMSGFNIVAQAVEETTINPKTIGKVVIATVWASTLFYIFIIIGASFSSSVGVREESQLVVIESLVTMFNGNQIPKTLVALAALIGMLTSWNAAYIGGSRVIFALGRAKYLPQRFARLSEKNQTPTYSIFLLFFISSIAAFLGTSQSIFTSIVNISGFMMSLSWLLVVIAFMRIRKNYPLLHRPFRVSNGKFIGIISLVSLVGLMILYTPLNPMGGLTLIELTILTVIILLIICLYVFYVRRHPVSHEERKLLLLGEELSEKITENK